MSECGPWSRQGQCQRCGGWNRTTGTPCELTLPPLVVTVTRAPRAPSLRYRLRYLSPRNERALVDRLHEAVLAGVLSPYAALESYKREAWIVQGKTARSLLLLPNPGLHPRVTFLMAEETRLFCRRTVEG